MPRRNAARMLGRSRSPSPSAADRNWWFAIGHEPQVIRIFLPPLEPRLLPIDPQAQIVLVPIGHLARPQHPPRPASTQQHSPPLAVHPPPPHQTPHFSP